MNDPDRDFNKDLDLPIMSMRTIAIGTGAGLTFWAITTYLSDLSYVLPFVIGGLFASAVHLETQIISLRKEIKRLRSNRGDI
ncbi:hypothetical protein DEM27_10340 [Metarhizobium album]|uniref:Uncharacterized protein n=1 Tax=Metarhizobium album TaxID=2182425 RepID=A0A2U2DTX1_9HYPH|nr:hypothetical protein [Rhizobium album]PWE56752.1 hypothetical protein DEM27_10340 [Rhizobium album]